MKKFAPKTQLTAIEDIWGPYYISRAKAMLDGTWKPDDAWWGVKEGTVVMSPFSSAMPANVKAAADKVIAGWKDGSYDVFTGEIKDQRAVKVPKGERMADKDLAVIDWYVRASMAKTQHNPQSPHPELESKGRERAGVREGR